ncbi:electron transfer flavoprotein subunit alpha/FixB family protein [Nocardioides panacisoli]|uniref:electron transfer flavoprotein subunit alpha/FixB family protein n=1 Tax=Nocardioides panacisoli TaxID=627624 RepID=UPI001C63631E|nr:electron transfer flavoprotein subunit alpha/FixB family protein [Nocardioides panacisoli]QYJ02914.1 electron transfer flavoprotein subunit alpha/FixB family protein [Nocardioides panacisoli]
MILVFLETEPDGLTETSREALTLARGLAGESGGAPVDAVLVGAPSCPADTAVEQAAAYGVRDLHHATGEAFDAYGGAVWATAVEAVCRDTGAGVVVAAGTPRGMEVLAHVAARGGVAMAANVVAAEGSGPLTVTRQVMNGAVLEDMVLDEDPAILTVAGHAVEARPAAEPGAGRLVPCRPEVPGADLVARVVSAEPPPPDLSGDLTSARVVVGGGRGVGSADGFADLLELTDLVGGALGVSRVVTGNGWRPHHEQVGQTGSRISPDLYLACGISGAIQHWAGCASARTIVAINTDPEAPMVTRAHYAVIGDLHEVVPAVIEEIRRRRDAP